MSEKATAYRAQLDSFLALEEDWDSYGAAPIDPQMLGAVWVFLDAVCNGRASVVPTRTGGVQVEIHERGVDVEVEFDPEGEDQGSVYVNCERGPS